MKPFPLITAHTGCMGTADNTLLSIETGLKLGADIIEEDILITLDGVLVLSHDDHIYSIDGTEFRISQTNYTELKKLNIMPHHGADGEVIRILSLDSVLPLMQASGKTMNLDIKSDDCVEPVTRQVEKNGLLGQVILTGCEIDRAKMVQRANPNVRKLLNVETSLFLKQNYTAAVTSCCEDAKSASCFGLNLNYRVVQPELMEIAAGYGLDVYIWTVNEKEQMKQFIEMGVQSITSRNVEDLVKLKQNV